MSKVTISQKRNTDCIHDRWAPCTMTNISSVGLSNSANGSMYFICMWPEASRLRYCIDTSAWYWAQNSSSRTQRRMHSVSKRDCFSSYMQNSGSLSKRRTRRHDLQTRRRQTEPCSLAEFFFQICTSLREGMHALTFLWVLRSCPDINCRQNRCNSCNEHLWGNWASLACQQNDLAYERSKRRISVRFEWRGPLNKNNQTQSSHHG